MAYVGKKALKQLGSDVDDVLAELYTLLGYRYDCMTEQSKRQYDEHKEKLLDLAKRIEVLTGVECRSVDLYTPTRRTNKLLMF